MVEKTVEPKFCLWIKSIVIQTSRERHKSAPYLRLKIAKGLQSVKYSLLQYPKYPKVGFFIHSVANYQKIAGGLWVEKFQKSLTMPKKQRGTFGIFRSRKKFSTTYAIVLFFLFFFLPTFS